MYHGQSTGFWYLGLYIVGGFTSNMEVKVDFAFIKVAIYGE